jgi:hypothetical protein
MAKVIETVFVGEDCWRSLDGEALGACTDCGEFDMHINDEFGGFDSLLFGYVPDKEPSRKHELLGGNEVLCQNSFDQLCEEAVAQGKTIERHDGFFVGTPGGLDAIINPAL